MKEVQSALKVLIDEGLYVSRSAWMNSTNQMHSPKQYVVYSVSESESLRADDTVQETLCHIYMNLWSETDPTETADRIREMMYAAGFWRVRETDRGYNEPTWSHMTRSHCIFWTWGYRRRVDYAIGAEGS